MTRDRGAAAPWISVPLPSPAARWRLIALPYAGGGASFYYPWAKELSALGVEVCAAQLPGRENRIGEPPWASLPAVIEAIAAAVAPRLDRPFVLFGHSMGALLAFELARALRARGAPAPRRLFASGCRAPDIPFDEEPLHALPDAVFVEAVARKYQGIPSGVLQNPELLELTLPALRADLSMTEGYAYAEAPPLPTPISAWGGEADRHVAEEQLRAWSRHTAGGFDCALFPGDHFYLAENRARLVGALRHRLEGEG